MYFLKIIILIFNLPNKSQKNINLYTNLKSKYYALYNFFNKKNI